jgi:hypothetical protein
MMILKKKDDSFSKKKYKGYSKGLSLEKES